MTTHDQPAEPAERLLCECWGCDQSGQPVPDLRDWPDRRGAQLRAEHRQAAVAAQQAGADAYHQWIMQNVAG